MKQMLRSLKELYGYDIQADDGEIGKVHDFYFDEEEWTTRYLVVDTGPWFLGEKVLIAPSALGKPNWASENFPVNLSRQQIQDSPNVNTALPISKQQQIALHEYFRWPHYWTSATPFAKPAMPFAGNTSRNNVRPQDPKKEVLEHMMQENSKLRSAKEVIGYTVNGEDGKLGRVDDIIIDDGTWRLLYLVLDTSTKLLNGKKTLIAIAWIKWITYKDREVQLELRQQMIENSPPFDPETPITRSFEEVLYDYHGRPYLRTEKNATPS
jgi:sporulation protein YlmC with PRC-barrel domain